MLVGRLLFQPLFWWIQRQRWIHWSRHCYSVKWYTVENLPPNVTDLVLPCVYWLHHHHPAYLLLSSYSVDRWLHISTSIFFLSESCLSAISVILMSQRPCIFAIISSAILIHCPFHIANLTSLSLSNCIYHALIVLCHLHHTTSMPPPSLLSYIYATSTVSLSTSFHVAVYAIFFIPYTY